MGEVRVFENRYGRAGDESCWGNQKKMTSQRSSRMKQKYVKRIIKHVMKSDGG